MIQKLVYTSTQLVVFGIESKQNIQVNGLNH